MGLPSLQGSNLDKVVAANKIYVGLANFLDLLCSLQIPWTVENPESSLLWQLPCFAHLVRAYPRVCFDMCCYGGARLTHRSLLTSCPAIDHLRQRCPGGHTHLPWKPFRRADGSMHFPTQDEAAYPRPFCQQFVLLVFRHLGLGLLVPFRVVTLRTLWLPLGFQKGGEGGGRQTVSPHERKHVLRLRLHIYIYLWQVNILILERLLTS